MRRRNNGTHTLLNANDSDDILLIQEPWFGEIGVERNDLLAQGASVLGGAANPSWNLHYPYYTDTQRAKVMTYVRIHDRSHIFKPNYFRATARRDLCAHPCILISDILINQRRWRFINFYNDVDDHTTITTLLKLTIDPTIPTLVAGDFNAYSPTWSPNPDCTQPSSTSICTGRSIEHWATANLLFLSSPPGIHTCQGEHNQHNSVLDLVWLNGAALQDDHFGNVKVNWSDNFGSDHALLCIPCTLNQKIPRYKEDASTGFYTSGLDSDAWEEWTRLLKDQLPRSDNLTNPHTIDEATISLHQAFDMACTATMKRRGKTPGRKARWWNTECSDMVEKIRQADGDEKSRLQRDLAYLIHRTKKTWVDEFIQKTDLWDVAKWRHRRKQSGIPALQNSEGQLQYDHESMAELLSKRFFAPARDNIPTRFPDNPEPLPTRPFEPLNGPELESLLKEMSNSSAPGTSGISYELLKRGWGVVEETLTNIYNTCLRLGYHPTRWKEAKVVVIPKPNKADYSVPKAHRPISLLETLSKLLEKAISKESSTRPRQVQYRLP